MPIPAGRRLLAVLLLAVTAVSACSDDAKEQASGDTTTTAATTTSSPASSTPAAVGTKSVAVKGVDYKFEGVPAQMPAGSKFEFTNGSTKELHELVAVRIPDAETQPVSELVQLPESETDAIFGPLQPATVVVAPPGGGAPVSAVGDGTIAQPGRYAVVCFIPVGADPAAYLAAIENDTEAPPNAAGGQSHARSGMFAEVKVS